MKNSVKMIAKLLVSTAALAGLSAQAATVEFSFQSGIQAASNNNLAYGKTSTRINSNNTTNAPSGTGAGFYVETFDGDNVLGVPISTPGQGCGLATLDSSLISVGTGSYDVRKGTLTDVGATPAGDKTCFAYGPGPTYPDGRNAKIKVDYSGLPPMTRVAYLGVYYGSIDTYNDIAFYDGASLMLGGGGLLDDGILSGSEILALLGGSSGDQVSDKSNVYVNIDFAESEHFTAFEFRTTGIAFELDNVVTEIRDIPEPASVLLFSLGLLGLAGIRRKT